ncbi:hypothetical protein H4Q26_013390 [Puccinia striiformis f. sp. tritici PST-130]|nr:hypothetical protein H4Q26_013390 [Puccinia striiformis f. sp. tritici PST-130]
MTSTERSSRTVSPLLLPRELSTYRPTIDYEELSQENAGSSVESFHEKGLPPSTGTAACHSQANQLRKIAFTSSMPRRASQHHGVVHAFSCAPHSKVQRCHECPTNQNPLQGWIAEKYEVECDTPLQIVADEAMPTSSSEYDGEKSRRERPGQLHGFWSLESAEYYPQIKRARQQLVMKDPKAFDFEVTYKTSSDFPIPYAYGFIDFRKASLAFEARRQDKIAAAFISNCDPLNNRTQILQQLIDLLPGQIFNLNPLTNDQPATQVVPLEEKMRIIQRYKFTIAFENSNEEDYVTEKYYQALEAGSIPIHLGQTPEQFEKFKPSTNSTLNVADFKTVEALADRIKQIAHDRVSFESMLAWKNEQFPERFEEILGYGKLHEACRIAKFLRRKWRNPHAFNQERYDSFYQRLNLNAE